MRISWRVVLDRRATRGVLSGRVDTVLRWMEWLEAEGKVERYPDIAVHGALTYALLGPPERSGAMGRGRRAGNARPASLPTAARWRACWRISTPCSAGTASTRCGATRAQLERAQPVQPLSARRCCTPKESRTSWRATSSRPLARIPRPRLRRSDSRRRPRRSLAVVLAERGIVAIERDDSARSGAARATRSSYLDDGSFDEYWTSAAVYAWLARVALHRGDGPLARPSRRPCTAARLRRCSTYVLPVSRCRHCSSSPHPRRAGRPRRRAGRLAPGSTTSSSTAPISACWWSRPSRSPGGHRDVQEAKPSGVVPPRPRPPRSCDSSASCRRTSRWREIGDRLYVSRNTVKTPGGLDLPEARCVVAGGRRRAGPGAGPARQRCSRLSGGAPTRLRRRRAPSARAFGRLCPRR